MDGDLHDSQLGDYTARVPFGTVLASIAGLWLSYFVLATLRWELLGLGFSQELLWPRAPSRRSAARGRARTTRAS